MKRKNEDVIKPNLLFILIQAVWRGISWLMQSIWQIIRWAATHSWHLIVWVLKQPFQLLYYLLNGRVPQFENARQEEAFWRVKRRYRRLRFLTLHSAIFVLVSLIALIAVGAGIYTLQTSTFSSPEDLQWEWVHLRNGLLNGGFGLVIWLVILGIHTMLVRTAQSEDDELERVMAREYERTERETQQDYDYSHLAEQDGEIDFEFEAAKAKRSVRQKH